MRKGSDRVVWFFAWSRHTEDTVATASLDPCAFETRTRSGISEVAGRAQTAWWSSVVFQSCSPGTRYWRSTPSSSLCFAPPWFRPSMRMLYVYGSSRKTLPCVSLAFCVKPSSCARACAWASACVGVRLFSVSFFSVSSSFALLSWWPALFQPHGKVRARPGPSGEALCMAAPCKRHVFNDATRSLRAWSACTGREYAKDRFDVRALLSCSEVLSSSSWDVWPCARAFFKYMFWRACRGVGRGR